MQEEVKAKMAQEVAALAKQRDDMNATVTDKVAKMEADFELQKRHIEESAKKEAALRANATMSRRQAEAERQLDAAVNHEREKLKREAREQLLEEEDAKAILEKTRDWQEDVEEKRYESYMKQFAVQTGSSVNGVARSKEDETPEKPKAAPASAEKPKKAEENKPAKQLADIAKVVDDKKADKIAAKVVEKEAAKPKKEEKKPEKDNAKKAPVSAAMPEKKSAPALGKSAKLQVAAADLHATTEHVDEPRDMKDDDGSLPKSMDQENDEDEASDSKKPANSKEADDSVGKHNELTHLQTKKMSQTTTATAKETKAPTTESKTTPQPSKKEQRTETTPSKKTTTNEQEAAGKSAVASLAQKPVYEESAPQPPVAHVQLTADDFDDEEDEESEQQFGQGTGVQSLVQRLVDHQGDDADKYDFADTFSELTADELVESNEQAYDG